MVLHTDEIIQEWEVDSIYDFMNKVGFERELLAKYGDTEDIIESKNFSSDEEAIAEILDEATDKYTMIFISDRHDGYWIIRKIL